MPELPQLFYGSSPAVREMLRQAQAFARTPYPILILGAPGTGKTELARHLHRLSGRPREKFARCSIPNLADGISQAELLGSGRGAFTGAVDRAGLVEGVTGGTLFLDELGLASPGLQGVLLALFDDPVVRRLGQERERPVDVRYLAATNADLDQMAAAGAFRPDLLGRFGYFKLRVPSLAERRDEIPPLFERFLIEEYALLGKPWLPELGHGVTDCLLAAPWRDNVRELRNLCRFVAVCHPPGDPIELDDLPPAFQDTLGQVHQARRARAKLRRARAEEAVVAAGGNKTQAAEGLRVSRQYLHRMLTE